MNKHNGTRSGLSVHKIDYSQFKTDVSKRRRSAITRELTKIAYSVPNSLISLAEGMPNEGTFPFTEISVKLIGGSSFSLEEEELATALQYIPSQGYPPLLQILREFQRKVHAPPLWESREIVVVSGAQDGLSKALEATIGPGDPILVQNPYYPGVEVVLSPYEAELIPVSQDDCGLDPVDLREIMKNRLLSGKKMPKLMYINATGANPTGTVLSLERRKEIYRIACEYNFLIIDDDPYHHLYFTEEAPKSFLSLDTEGRVIRLDSFSKILSSGLRIGFLTAAAPLAASIEVHMQSSHLHASTLSQVIVYKLMKVWGYDKLIDHFRRVRCFYRQRRDIISALAMKHLHGLAEFSIPSAGFFLWIKVPGIQDTWKMVMQRGLAQGILVAPGAAFMVDPSQACNAIRACFAKATYEDMDLAMERLAQLIREELLTNHSIMNDSA